MEVLAGIAIGKLQRAVLGIVIAFQRLITTLRQVLACTPGAAAL